MENKDNSRLIFVVEDNEMFALTVKAGLMANKEPDAPKTTVEVFHTGEDMLVRLDEKDTTPDVVILDFFLNSKVPEAKDGDEILKEFRDYYKNKKLSAPPVIMLTASKDVNSAVSLLKKGAVDYIIKDGPVSDNLKKSIDKVVVFRRLKEESKENKKKADKYKKGLVVSLSIVGIVVAALVYILFRYLLK